jgi:hypothetical protein
MRDASTRYDLEALAAMLREAVPEFVPTSINGESHAHAATVVAFPARNARRT